MLDIKSMYKNQLCLYTPAANNWKYDFKNKVYESLKQLGINLKKQWENYKTCLKDILKDPGK